MFGNRKTLHEFFVLNQQIRYFITILNFIVENSIRIADYLSTKLNIAATSTFGASILISGSLNLGMQYLWSYLNTI